MTRTLRREFDAQSDLLGASFKAGELTHFTYRKQVDQLEAKLSRDIAIIRGHERFWDCTTYQWEPVQHEQAP